MSCSFFYRDIFKHFYFLYFFYVQICANWEGFSDAESGIALYIVNVWTSDSGVTTKVVNDTQFSRTTSSACFDLAAGNHLQHGKMYYVTVQAFNSANKQLNVSATSDGGKFYKTYMKSHGKAFLFFYEVLVVKKIFTIYLKFAQSMHLTFKYVFIVIHFDVHEQCLWIPPTQCLGQWWMGRMPPSQTYSTPPAAQWWRFSGRTSMTQSPSSGTIKSRSTEPGRV